MKEGWEVRPLGEVATLNYGKALPKSDRDPEGAVPAFGANGIKDWTNRSLSDGPSIIIGRKGSAGEVTFVDGPFWPLDVTYYVDHDRIASDLRYLDYWLKNADLQSLARGVKPGLNRNDVYALDFPLPPLEEQRRIVAVLDEAFDGLARARANIEANLADAECCYKAVVDDQIERSGGQLRAITDVCQFEGGSQPPKSTFVDSPTNGYVRLLQIRDFSSDTKAVYIPEDSHKKRCSKEDVMIGRYGASVGQIHRGKSGAYNVALIKTIPDPELIDNEFFYHLLKSNIFQRPLLDRSSRGAQDGFNKGDLTSIKIPVPPLNIQKRLARAALQSRNVCDEFVRRYTAQLADLATLRQSLLARAFRGELT